MVKFKFEDKMYIAFDYKEALNPHEKKYPCIVDAATGEIPTGSQRKILLSMLENVGVTYTRYDLKDTNTYDLVEALLAMSKYFVL